MKTRKRRKIMKIRIKENTSFLFLASRLKFPEGYMIQSVNVSGDLATVRLIEV